MGQVSKIFNGVVLDAEEDFDTRMSRAPVPTPPQAVGEGSALDGLLGLLGPEEQAGILRIAKGHAVADNDPIFLMLSVICAQNRDAHQVMTDLSKVAEQTLEKLNASLCASNAHLGAEMAQFGEYENMIRESRSKAHLLLAKSFREAASKVAFRAAFLAAFLVLVGDAVLRFLFH
jgi:hypothetical protein